MDSSRPPKRTNPRREAKGGQSEFKAPGRKDAYARLLSQHRSSAFTKFLEQYAKESSLLREDHGTNTLPQAQSDKMSIPQVSNHLSDSSDFSPSSLKDKGDESSLSLYMEKLSIQNAQQDSERKPGVSEKNRNAQRRDTATSQDGDIESGEELNSFGPNDSKKHQRQRKKNKDASKENQLKDISQFVENTQDKTNVNQLEQEDAKKTKNNNLPKQLQEGKPVALIAKCSGDSHNFKSPHDLKKLQKPTGTLEMTSDHGKECIWKILIENLYLSPVRDK